MNNSRIQLFDYHDTILTLLQLTWKFELLYIDHEISVLFLLKETIWGDNFVNKSYHDIEIGIVLACAMWRPEGRASETDFPSQGRSQDFSKGRSQQGHHPGIADYMVYTAALPRVSAGSVVLSGHEGPY